MFIKIRAIKESHLKGLDVIEANWRIDILDERKELRKRWAGLLKW